MRVNILRRSYWFVRGILLSLVGLFIQKRPMPDLTDVKEILLVALFRIGDAVYATPVIRELKHYLPDVSIDIACRSYSAAVFQNSPHIRTLLILKKGIIEFLRIKKILHNDNYDLIIDLTGDDKLIGALIARISSRRHCMGYNVQKRGFCLDRPLSLPEKRIHGTGIFLNLLTDLAIPVNEPMPELFLLDKEKTLLSDTLKQYGVNETDFIVGLHPGANFPSQCLHPEKWATLCDSIQEKFHVKVILFGGPKDRQRIALICNNAAKNIIAFEKLPHLRQAMALIDRCQILLCNNSGPLHIAEALGTPTLSWMGPTIPYRWYPLGEGHEVIQTPVDCSPCNRGVCNHHRCETSISIEELEARFTKLFNTYKPGRPCLRE